MVARAASLGKLLAQAVFVLGAMLGGLYVLLVVSLALAQTFHWGSTLPVTPIQTLPADFPGAFPIYDGARPVSASQVGPSDDRSSFYEFLTPGTADKVIAWYRQQLTRGDWRPGKPMCCGTPTVTFESRTEKLFGNLTADDQSDGTHLHVTITRYTHAAGASGPQVYLLALAPLAVLLVQQVRRRRLARK
jgi:hypothetical protein